MALHGPHQGAQKSTRTGSCDSRTVTLNSASVTFTVSTPGIDPPNTASGPLAGPAEADDVHGSRRVRIPSFAKVPGPVKLFLPQSTLEEWASGDKADVHEHALVLSGDSVEYPVDCL